MDLCKLSCAAAFLIVIRIVENNTQQEDIRANTTGESAVQPILSHSSCNFSSAAEIEGNHTHFDVDEIRIVDGVPAQPGEFPFMVSIQSYYTWQSFCGGSLLSDRHVLTACHCIVFDMVGAKPRLKSPSYMSLLAGTIDLSDSRGTGARRDALMLRRHPDCIKLNTGWTWDFGLITVSGRFRLLPHGINKIKLPYFRNYSIEKMSYEQKQCTGMGWGRIDPYRTSKITSRILMKVELQLQPENTCSELVLLAGRMMRFNEVTQVCTLGEGNRDACQGDSGGPLICVSDRGESILTAIVSWGIGCGRYKTPGIWARLDIAESWIREGMAHASHNSPSSLAGFGFLTMIIKTVHSSLLSCCFLEYGIIVKLLLGFLLDVKFQSCSMAL